MKQLLNKKPNEHEIPAVTVSYHSTKLGVSIFFFLKKKVLVLWLLRKICCSASLAIKNTIEKLLKFYLNENKA